MRLLRELQSDQQEIQKGLSFNKHLKKHLKRLKFLPERSDKVLKIKANCHGNNL